MILNTHYVILGHMMALSVFRALGLGEPHPTNNTLLLENKSHISLEGIIDDLLIKQENFLILVDFIIDGRC